MKSAEQQSGFPTPGEIAGIVELRTKIVSLSSFAIGTALAARARGELDWVRFVLMAAAVLAVDMGTTGFNSFFDLLRGVDSRSTNRERDKVLVHRAVAPGWAFIISAALFALAGVLGIALVFMVGFELLVVGAACMAVGFWYTGGPLPISSTPFGELFAGGFLGWVLVVLSYYVQATAVSAPVLIAALPSMLIIGAILAVNNACDMVGDTAAGRKTLAILVGPRAAAWVVYTLLFGAFGLAAYLSGRGALPSCTLGTTALGALVALPITIRMHRRGYSHATKGTAMKSISGVFLIFTAAVLTALIFC